MTISPRAAQEPIPYRHFVQQQHQERRRRRRQGPVKKKKKERATVSIRSHTHPPLRVDMGIKGGSANENLAVGLRESG